MSGEGRVRVVVRSRKVPLGLVYRTEPVYSASGVLVGSRPSQLLVYGTSVDEEHLRTISEARKLARKLGLGLEVVDQTKAGIIDRLLYRLGRSSTAPAEIVAASEAPPMTSGSSPVVPSGC